MQSCVLLLGEINSNLKCCKRLQRSVDSIACTGGVGCLKHFLQWMQTAGLSS